MPIRLIRALFNGSLFATSVLLSVTVSGSTANNLTSLTQSSHAQLNGMSPVSQIPTQQLATNGDRVIQFFLARNLLDGQNPARNLNKSIEFYTLSAKQGFAPAQIDLGQLFASGVGVEKNLQTAFFWFEKAARQGYATAQYNLANMYRNGNGVARNYPQAVNYYRLAAESGFAKAQFNLGLMYYFGLGIKQDFSQVIHWYQLAAAQDFHSAQYYLATLYKNGEGVRKNLTRALHLYEKASEGGSIKADEALQAIKLEIFQQHAVEKKKAQSGSEYVLH